MNAEISKRDGDIQENFEGVLFNGSSPGQRSRREQIVARLS